MAGGVAPVEGPGEFKQVLSTLVIHRKSFNYYFLIYKVGITIFIYKKAFEKQMRK
jgi:hypothetical protein